MAEYGNKLKTALKEAMKAKDKQSRDTIRMLTSAFQQVEVDERRDLSSDDELKILQKEAKKRRESIAELQQAGRDDDVKNEQFELDLIEQYLPQQLSREELEPLVRDAIAASGAESMQDMGKVMSAVMPKTQGRADGKLVSSIVRELLGS